MNTLKQYTTFYFIGIGGIGMSALARYFHSIGKQVLGYDKTETKLTKTLQSEGISIQFEDEITPEITALKPETTLVIYTPAIKTLGILDHFKNHHFEVLKRAQVLGLITADTQCIAIAGTHGKTTTSSLVAHLCQEAGLPFSAFLGGISENFGSNFFYNGNDYTVVEADEYDRSFLHLSPDWAIITSTDADHLDIYGDKATIEQGFKDFAHLVPHLPQLFVRKGINIGRNATTYAVNEKADYYADGLELRGDQMAFDFHTPEGEVASFSWDIPGIHNVENATAALAVLHRMGVDLSVLKEALSRFKGIKRRYTKHNFENGKIYIDDYAHHPTELNAVLGSIRTFYPEKKLLVLFQPHLFSRTKDFADDFAKSLAQGDALLLLDIYPARERQEHFEGINSAWLLDKIELEDKAEVSLEETLEAVKTKDFDILLTVGAGNIDTLYEPLVEYISALPKSQ
ncbi:UDP-N-acetylmuramate--L-alanine ligase [Riemerella columbina]|uniref:UDP-N-acetylmuramate--L-alanine ligase n=1 Tax=Riemerella columbina TaxID=103810 RepID=UPI002670A7AD|nr:UDP-N-acetylmuramate--L-alanine ligase [Riemerella columbina]WKS95378.1 UDP-N-acetylmuramate--L-alanine ligase [Riemerella columbina]